MPVSLVTEVMRTPSRPQGTTHSNGCRSLSTLMAKPWVVTPRETWTPIEPILRSSTQTPVRPSRGPAVDALLGQRGDDRLLHRAQVGDDVVDAHDRVAHELARAVVGQLAAAVAS